MRELRGGARSAVAFGQAKRIGCSAASKRGPRLLPRTTAERLRRAARSGKVMSGIVARAPGSARSGSRARRRGTRPSRSGRRARTPGSHAPSRALEPGADRMLDHDLHVDELPRAVSRPRSRARGMRITGGRISSPCARRRGAAPPQPPAPSTTRVAPTPVQRPCRAALGGRRTVDGPSSRRAWNATYAWPLAAEKMNSPLPATGSRSLTTADVASMVGVHRMLHLDARPGPWRRSRSARAAGSGAAGGAARTAAAARGRRRRAVRAARRAPGGHGGRTGRVAAAVRNQRRDRARCRTAARRSPTLAGSVLSAGPASSSRAAVRPVDVGLERLHGVASRRSIFTPSFGFSMHQLIMSRSVANLLICSWNFGNSCGCVSDANGWHMAQAMPVFVSCTPSFFSVAAVAVEEQVADLHLLHEDFLERLELIGRVLLLVGEARPAGSAASPPPLRAPAADRRSSDRRSARRFMVMAFPPVGRSPLTCDAP